MKKLIAPSFVVAVLCGYMALFTPDWKSELHAQAGYYPLDAQYDGVLFDDETWVQ